MFTRLLVPLDGSRLAESVLPVVRRLASIIHCSILLLHVIEKKPPSTIHGDVHLRNVDDAESYLTVIAKVLRDDGYQVAIHVHTVPQGDIPKCIAEHAVELDQDLIMLCSHGAGGVRRFVFGTNAEQVLTHGATPVMFVQANDRGESLPFGPDHILVLLDGTVATAPALSIGSTLAKLANARLLLVGAVATYDSISGEQAAAGRLTPTATRHLLDLAAEETAEYLNSEAKSLIAEGIPVEVKLDRGDAATSVVREAEEGNCDLVVLAVRGTAGLSAFWADAVTRKVAGSYRGALLLIPRAKV